MSDSQTNRDVIVIGAGPAGTIASIALARRGVRVTLIERTPFPREKVCGECLSTLGLDTLQRLDLHSLLNSSNPSILVRSTIVSASGNSHTLPLPRAMRGIRRSVMDVILLEAARSLGVDVRQPAVVTSVEAATSTQAPRVQLRDGSLSAAYVIIADGKSALLDQRPEPTGSFGLKAHFRGVNGAPDTIELVGLGGGGYAGLAPVDDGYFNAAWSVPASMMRAYAGDLDRLFSDQLAANRWLRRSFAAAERTSEWLACPLPRFGVRPRWPRGIIPVGNAAAALEPVGGEGMGLAMRSAELAANAIADAIAARRPLDAAALRRQFRGLWTIRRLACRAGAIGLADDRFANVTIDAARSVPALTALGMRLVGKS